MARRRTHNSFHVALPGCAGFAWAATALVLIGAALLWQGPLLLTAIGSFLVVEDNPSKADAIVVLSGDGGARLEQGVELFQTGYARWLILVGGGQQGSPPAADVMRTQAAELGVPQARMLMVDQSTSTREDALYTRELMVRQGLKSAILVTSPYHERRASLTFAKAFQDTGISVASYPVQDDQWHPNSWWQNGATLRLTIVELAKLAYYKLNGYL